MRTPDRGSTTGETRWTVHERSEWAARRASEASQSPPSPPLFKMRACTKVRAFFFYIPRTGGMRTPDRGSTTGETRWTDRERSEWAARRASEASQSPPHRHSSKKSSHENAGFFFACISAPGGMRIPDRGSTTGDSPLDRPRAQRVGCPKGERSESIPPVHAPAAEPVPDGGYALSGLRVQANTVPYPNA